MLQNYFDFLIVNYKFQKNFKYNRSILYGGDFYLDGQSYMKLPYDLSGSMAKNRFKNELLWGIHRILELYTDEKKFNMVFDYVCDIEVHWEDEKYEFYQIKTSNSGEGYTQSKLTKIGKKEKSVLAKLYILKNDFDGDKDKIKLAIVSNKPFKDSHNTLYNNTEKLEFNTLDSKIKNSIEESLKKEMKIDKVDFNNMNFIYTTIDLINPKNTITGELVNLFSDVLKVQIKKPDVLYRVLLDKISQKAEYELKVNTYDELIEKKSLSKENIMEIFNKHIDISNNSVEKAKNYIEKEYSDNYGKKLKMMIALSSVVQKINISNILKKMEKEIIEYINNNNKLLEDSLNNIIDKLYKKYKEKFEIEYSDEEIKSFLILILMKREEEMYE